MFELRFSSSAKKFLRDCDVKLRNRLKLLFETLSQVPLPAKDYDLKKISGTADTYRIRLSSYRVVYVIYSDQKLIRLLKIERRDESTYNW